MNNLSPNLKSDSEANLRQSFWKQGSILPANCAVALNLSKEDEKDRIFLVVSHDCDLAERDLAKEPFAEVVEAFIVDKCDPNLTNSKSTRLLHIEAERDGELVCLELRVVTKRTVEKEVLERFQPDSHLVLVWGERNNLSHWLAARYKRAAFRNALLDRIGNKILESLARLSKKSPHAIMGIFIDYDPEDELENSQELYELWFYFVYSSQIEGAVEIAKGIAMELRQKFEREFLTSQNHWHLVELRQCEAVADTSFSVYEAKRANFFRLDHISLRQSPPADVPDIF